MQCNKTEMKYTNHILHFAGAEGSCCCTGCVSESGELKSVMNSKYFHLFNVNKYEHSVYIKEFRFFLNFNLTHLTY
jgi:hypothetical protein